MQTAGRQLAATGRCYHAGVTEPLARVSFEFGLDELMDVTRRSTARLHTVRQRELFSLVFVLILIATLTPTALFWSDPDSSPALVAVATAIAVTFGYLANRHFCARRREKVTRGILRELYGDGRHRCDIELHHDRMTMSQLDTSTTVPWSQVESIADDNGDLIVTAHSSVTVVRKFAFPDDAARIVFHDRVRQLVRQHRERPTS